MVGSFLAPKWPIMVPFCGVDHQKSNFSLISDTLSVGGCWGQSMLLFWKLVDETQMVKPPEPTIYHDSKKYLILLPLRAIYFRSFHYETPCRMNLWGHRFSQNTASCELWKHSNPTPGGRPMFFKAKLPKKSKNGFKTSSCRRYPVMFFSKNYFRHQKSSKNWTFCWFLNFYGNIYGLANFKKNNCRTFRIRWNITKMIKFFICTFFNFEKKVFDAKKMLLYL
mgnify:CR=1 FL=1